MFNITWANKSYHFPIFNWQFQTKLPLCIIKQLKDLPILLICFNWDKMTYLKKREHYYYFRYNNGKRSSWSKPSNTTPYKFNCSFCMCNCFQTTRLISAFLAFRVHFTRIIHVQIWSETKRALFFPIPFSPSKKCLRYTFFIRLRIKLCCRPETY